MVFKNLCVLVHWMKVALALEGLPESYCMRAVGRSAERHQDNAHLNHSNAKDTFVQSKRKQIYIHEYPCASVSVMFSFFCHSVLATLATSTIRVNTLIMLKAAQKQGTYVSGIIDHFSFTNIISN